jgi:hypothetical protein
MNGRERLLGNGLKGEHLTAQMLRAPGNPRRTRRQEEIFGPTSDWRVSVKIEDPVLRDRLNRRANRRVAGAF